MATESEKQQEQLLSKIKTLEHDLNSVRSDPEANRNILESEFVDQLVVNAEEKVNVIRISDLES